MRNLINKPLKLKMEIHQLTQLKRIDQRIFLGFLMNQLFFPHVISFFILCLLYAVSCGQAGLLPGCFRC